MKTNTDYWHSAHDELSHKAVAERFGISDTHVKRIWSGARWQRVPLSIA